MTSKLKVPSPTDPALSVEARPAFASVQGFSLTPTQLPASDRRDRTRYEIARPVLVVPVLPNGEPAWDVHAYGISWDVSQHGIGFQVEHAENFPSRTVLLGVETQSGNMQFATAVLRHSVRAGSGIRHGAEFLPADADPLRDENLVPQVDPATLSMKTGLSTDVLHRWAQLGVMRPMLLDYVEVCPKCGALPTYRRGCKACGSAHVGTTKLIHHFACAHVDFVANFQTEGHLECPKCHVRGLIVGADFEHLDGPYRCLDCQWSDTELEQVAQCLRCRYRFPSFQASQTEVVGFHVERLDVLALLGSS